MKEKLVYDHKGRLFLKKNTYVSEVPYPPFKIVIGIGKPYKL